MLSFKNFIAEEAQAELDLITEMAVAVVGGEENYGTLDELSKATLFNYTVKNQEHQAKMRASKDHLSATRSALSNIDHYALHPRGRNGGEVRTASDNMFDAIHDHEKKLNRKIGKRQYNLYKAGMKLTKEDFDTILKMVEDSTELNELSKKTLGSYMVKAASSLGDHAHNLGHAKAKRDETDRFLNRHMSYGDKDKVAKMVGSPSIDDTNKIHHKIAKRMFGIKQSTKRLTKESTEMKAPVLASVEPYNDAHSLHDKAEQHRQIAKQAEHRYFNGGDEVDRVIYHAHMAKHHQFLEDHANHTESPETAATHRKMKLKNMKHIGSVAEGNGGSKPWSAIKESVDLNESYQMEPLGDEITKMSKVDHLKQAQHHRIMHSQYKAEASADRREAKNHSRHMFYKLAIRAQQHENNAALEKAHAEMHEAEAKRK